MIKRKGSELIISRSSLEDIIESYNPELDTAPPFEIPIDLAELALHSIFNDTSLRYRYKKESQGRGWYYFSFREQVLQDAIFNSPEAKTLLEQGSTIFKVEKDATQEPQAIQAIPTSIHVKTLNDWASYITEWSTRKGWDFSFNESPEKFMLMVSEIAEAMEEYRNVNITVDQSNGEEHIDFFYTKDGKPEGIAIELVDCIIRILHYLGKFNIDVDELMKIKMAYNEKRPFRHGNLKA